MRVMVKELDDLFERFNSQQVSVIKKSLQVFAEGGKMDLTEIEKVKIILIRLNNTCPDTSVFDRNFVSDWKIGKLCTRVGFLHGSWFLSTRKACGSHMVLMGLIMVLCSCMI
jgi:hypothetical protein